MGLAELFRGRESGSRQERNRRPRRSTAVPAASSLMAAHRRTATSRKPTFDQLRAAAATCLVTANAGTGNAERLPPPASPSSPPFHRSLLQWSPPPSPLRRRSAPRDLVVRRADSQTRTRCPPRVSASSLPTMAWSIPRGACSIARRGDPLVARWMVSCARVPPSRARGRPYARPNDPCARPGDLSFREGPLNHRFATSDRCATGNPCHRLCHGNPCRNRRTARNRLGALGCFAPNRLPLRRAWRCVVRRDGDHVDRPRAAARSRGAVAGVFALEALFLVTKAV